MKTTHDLLQLIWCCWCYAEAYTIEELMIDISREYIERGEY